MKEQPIDLLRSLPDNLSVLKVHLQENVIPIVNSYKGARYIFTKHRLNYEALKEVNIPRVFFDDDTKFSFYRLGRDSFDLDWVYYSKAYSSGYRNRQFGPKCALHTLNIYLKET